MDVLHSFRRHSLVPALLLLAFAATAAKADVSVVNSGFTWRPADIVVAVGETVHWSWTGSHNVAEVDGPGDTVWNGSGFRSGSPVSGGSFDQAFAEPGLHHYVCEPHAGLGMRGSVLVVAAEALHAVVNAGTSWTPADLVIETGDVVRWIWTGTHNVAEVDGPGDLVWNGSGFRSGAASSGGLFFQAFDVAGFHHYVCEPHAGLGMRGTIQVVEAGTLHLVVDDGNLWAPADIEINVGDTVHWLWTGFHNVAETDGPAENVWNGSGFYSGIATFGGQYSRTFSEAGLHWYVCDIHALGGMRGTVTVLPDCPDATPLAPVLDIAYEPGGQTVQLSWTAVTETVGGCPTTPLYRVLAGPAPDALSEIALTDQTSLAVAAGASTFFEVVAVAD